MAAEFWDAPSRAHAREASPLAERPSRNGFALQPLDIPDGLPLAYRIALDGSIERVADNDASIRICSPLRVLGLVRDSHGRGWGHLIEVTDPDGHVHLWLAPARLFGTAEGRSVVRATLMDLGLKVAPRQDEALIALLRDWTPRARLRSVERLGWTDGECTAFVLGDGRTIGGDSFVFMGAASPMLSAAMHSRGSLQDWREAVAGRCIANPLLIFAVSAALAGPLLEFAGFEGGGFHLRGASSRGKSTLLRAAASVWGAPDFVQSWRATANGLEGLAAAANSTCLILDEMGEVEARDAAAAAYMLANGAGKTRADKLGLARAPLRWRTLVLSSGEIGLADKALEAGRRMMAGQEVRLIDLAADTQVHGAFDDLHGAAEPSAFADALKAATAEAYGVAGPAFVAGLIGEPKAIRAQLRAHIAAFETGLAPTAAALDGQVARAVKRFALVAAAGELASAFAITGWPASASLAAARDVLAGWIVARGGAGLSAEAREAVRRVRAFLTAHGSSRFEPLKAEDSAGPPGGVRDRAGWRTGGLYFFAEEAWRALHAGADPQAAARALKDAGWLETGDEGRLKRKLPPSPACPTRPRAYAIRAAILEGEAD